MHTLFISLIMLVDLDYRRLFFFLVSYINFPNVGSVMTFGFLSRISFRFYSFLLVRCTCEGVGMWSDNFPMFPIHFLLEALVETFSFLFAFLHFSFDFSRRLSALEFVSFCQNEFLQESLQFCFISMLIVSFTLILWSCFNPAVELWFSVLSDTVLFLRHNRYSPYIKKVIPIVIKAISYMTAATFLSWLSKQVHNEIYHKRSGNILLRNL